MNFIKCFVLLVVTQMAFSQTMNIDAKRLEASWNTLRDFGYDSITTGNNRIAFSHHNTEALDYLQQKLEKLGMQVHRDAAGNLICQRAGKNNKLKPIAFGSHIDAVPNGGHYDGQVGVLGGIECLETLVDKNHITEHPLELIIFSNEESGVFGSRALAGKLTVESLSVKTASGKTNALGAHLLGGDPEKIFNVKREKGDLHSFLELHIEQGGILEEEGVDIGILQGIVWLRWWDVTITGVSNHAGTTPMHKRQDAMIAAARFVLMVNEVVKSRPGTHVGTVGRIKAEPGAPNVIPGKVVLSLELRDLNEKKLDDLFSEIVEKAHKLGAEYKVQFLFESISATGKAALTDQRIQDLIERKAKILGYTTKRMPSGAGHDSQEMTHIAPTGMIFIPSKGGISHSPDEFSSFEDMAKGTQLLLETILALDKENFDN